MSEARRIDDRDDEAAPAARYARVPMTVAEFRRWSAGQPGKWELVNGRPRALSPAGTTHGLIQMRAGVLIENQLVATGSPCRAVTEAAVLPASFRRNNARAADIAVTCAPPSRDRWDITDPVLILEVLSPSNEQDTRENVWAYMTIDSVQEILLLSSTAIEGEMFRRKDDRSWPVEASPIASGGIVRIEALGFECPVSAFYARTALALPPEDQGQSREAGNPT